MFIPITYAALNLDQRKPLLGVGSQWNDAQLVIRD